MADSLADGSGGVERMLRGKLALASSQRRPRRMLGLDQGQVFGFTRVVATRSG